MTIKPQQSVMITICEKYYSSESFPMTLVQRVKLGKNPEMTLETTGNRPSTFLQRQLQNSSKGV